MLEVIVSIVALVLVIFALLAVLAYMVSRRKDPDVEVARQMLNTAMDAYWAGMGVTKAQEDRTAAPQMMPALRNDVRYDPEEELADMRPEPPDEMDEADEINTPVSVTEAPNLK